MPPKAAPAAKAAAKAPTAPNPLFPARPRSQRVGGAIRVSLIVIIKICSFKITNLLLSFLLSSRRAVIFPDL